MFAGTASPKEDNFKVRGRNAGEFVKHAARSQSVQTREYKVKGISTDNSVIPFPFFRYSLHAIKVLDSFVIIILGSRRDSRCQET